METLITTHLVKDFDLGLNGNLYGGRMLDWLDEAGALFVQDEYKACFVTWKIGETIFHKPVKHNAIVKLYVCDPERRFHSVGFKLVARVDDQEVVTTSMVFVCIDPDTGMKKLIP